MKIARDKILHFGVCFIGTLVISIITFGFGIVASTLAGVTFSIGLGLGKEYGDSKAIGNKWDNKDILADLLGVMISSIIYVAIRLIVGR